MTTPAHKRSWLAPLLIGGGGLLTVGAVVFGVRKSNQVTQAIEKQVEAPPVSLPPSPQAIALLPTFNARLTGYYPFKEGLTAKQRLMEGGKKDRMSRPLITIEDHLRDPVNYPYVSVAGDWNIFPYGQRLQIDAWPNAVFRVVDTGGNFFGAKKMYRAAAWSTMWREIGAAIAALPAEAAKAVKGMAAGLKWGLIIGGSVLGVAAGGALIYKAVKKT